MCHKWSFRQVPPSRRAAHGSCLAQPQAGLEKPDAAQASFRLDDSRHRLRRLGRHRHDGRQRRKKPRRQEAIEKLGATNIIIRSEKPSDEFQAASGRSSLILSYGLKYDDYERLLETVPTIKRALPIREIRKEVRYLANSLDARVVGTTKDYADFMRLEIGRGRFLVASDNDRYENFAVLASDTARTLFPFEDALLKAIKIGDNYFTVVGVMKDRSPTAAGGGGIATMDFNRDVYVPLNTARLRFGEKIINMRLRLVRGGGDPTHSDHRPSRLDRRGHALRSGDPRRHRALSPETRRPFRRPLGTLASGQKKALQSLLLLGAIAAVSLIVGGIGIMNIMLATVTERTREIGIRRALGAKQRDITQQFLIETIVLSGVGGLLGVAIGITVPLLIHYFLPDMQTFVTFPSVILAFGTSLLVGILSGLYPARRAARMDPIEALRHE